VHRCGCNTLHVHIMPCHVWCPAWATIGTQPVTAGWVSARIATPDTHIVAMAGLLLASRSNDCLHSHAHSKLADSMLRMSALTASAQSRLRAEHVQLSGLFRCSFSTRQGTPWELLLGSAGAVTCQGVASFACKQQQIGTRHKFDLN
jgi:hypothetical protein